MEKKDLPQTNDIGAATFILNSRFADLVKYVSSRLPQAKKGRLDSIENLISQYFSSRPQLARIARNTPYCISGNYAKLIARLNNALS